MNRSNRNINNSLRYVLFAFIIVFILSGASSAFASPSYLDVPKVKPCKGLDIVFLVSYSSPTKFNDGVGLRQRAMRTALDIIGDNAIYLCPGFQHRIAVIGFGDLEDPTMSDWNEFVPPTNINPSLNNLGEWTSQKYKLLQSIPEFQDLGRYSNFRDGLIKASGILADWRKDGFDHTLRKQAVVIISDGDMCTWEYKCDFDNVSSKVFQDILPIVDPSSKYLDSSVTISHIGFYTTSGNMFQFWENSKIFEFWSNIVQQHSGKLFILQSGGMSINQDIDSKVSTVLNDLLGSDLGAASCDSTGEGIEPILVEPYKNNFLVLYVYRYGAFEGTKPSEVNVTIQVTKEDGSVEKIENGTNRDGNGQTLGGNNFDYIHEGPNDRFIFYQPPVGKYTIMIDKANPCKDVSILFGTHGIEAELLAPQPGALLIENDIDPYYDVNSPSRFSFQLSQLSRDGKNIALRQIDNYPLTVKIFLKAVDNIVTPDALLTYDLQLIDEEKSIWESEKPISLRYPGKYTWELVVQTKNPQLNNPTNPVTTPIDIFHMQGNLEIKPLEREFNFEVIVPPSTEKEILLTDKTASKPLLFRIQLYNATDKHPLREDLRISEPSQNPFLAKLLVDNNGRFDIVDSEPMVWEKGNTYTVELRPTLTGKFENGNYRLLIELNDDYNRSIFKYSNDREPVQRDFLVSVVQEQNLQWGMVHPVDGTTYSLRPAFNWFADPDSTDFFSIEVHSLGNETISSSESILKDDTHILFKGTLKAANGKTYEITYSPKEDSTLFVAQWPENAVPHGEYTLEKVEIVSENLSPVWINPTALTNFPVKFTFNRLPWTEPWSGLAAMILIIIFLAAVALIYLNAGPLFDTTVEFTSSRGALDPISGGIKLYRIFKTRGLKVSGSELAQQVNGGGLKEISVKNIKPSEQNARVAVDIELLIENLDTGILDTYPVPDVNEGHEVQIGPGQKLILSKGASGIVQRLKPVIVVSVVLLLVWLVAFAALYFLT